jgi:hypothetical protein
LPRVALRDFDYGAPAPERQIGLQRASVNTTAPARTSFTSRRPKLPRKR